MIWPSLRTRSALAALALAPVLAAAAPSFPPGQKDYALRPAGIGAGAAFGEPRIGMQARTTIDPQDYGLPAMFTDPIEILVDTEFERRP
jgi:hypothetical protein